MEVGHDGTDHDIVQGGVEVAGDGGQPRQHGGCPLLYQPVLDQAQVRELGTCQSQQRKKQSLKLSLHTLRLPEENTCNTVGTQTDWKTRDQSRSRG